MIESLGPYRILEATGAGGLGEVYRARDTRLGRTVAVTVLAPSIVEDGERLSRFLADARRTTAVSHPNVAVLYDVAEDGGVHYLAREWVTGETLGRIIGGRPLHPRRAIDIAVQVADALADADAHGLVHGDVSPENVLVTPKGSVKLLDFGLATWASTPVPVAQPLRANAAGAAAPDHRTDTLALGVLLFEMLTGKPPAGRRTLSAVADGLPRALDPIVLKALAKDPDARYQSAVTLAAELRGLAAGLDDRREPSERIAPPSVAGARRSSGAARRVAWFVGTAALAAAAWLLWTAMRVR